MGCAFVECASSSMWYSSEDKARCITIRTAFLDTATPLPKGLYLCMMADEDEERQTPPTLSAIVFDMDTDVVDDDFDKGMIYSFEWNASTSRYSSIAYPPPRDKHRLSCFRYYYLMVDVSGNWTWITYPKLTNDNIQQALATTGVNLPPNAHYRVECYSVESEMHAGGHPHLTQLRIYAMTGDEEVPSDYKSPSYTFAFRWKPVEQKFVHIPKPVDSEGGEPIYTYDGTYDLSIHANDRFIYQLWW